MTAYPAVGVHDDLPAREPHVPLRTARDELAGGVDVYRRGAAVEEVGRKAGPDDRVEERRLDLRVLDAPIVLRGQDDGRDGNGAVPVVGDRHL